MVNPFRIGFGYDVHQLAAGRTLVLGGVIVSEEIGCVAHSDGDVLIHAICDAILGAAALDDIGVHFPDTDAAYKGISSATLLRKTLALAEECGYSVGNVDSTLILERPKILPFRERIRESLASILGIPPDCVSVKATTSEKLGFVGEGRGVEAHAVVLLQSRLTKES